MFRHVTIHTISMFLNIVPLFLYTFLHAHEVSPQLSVVNRIISLKELATQAVAQAFHPDNKQFSSQQLKELSSRALNTPEEITQLFMPIIVKQNANNLENINDSKPHFLSCQFHRWNSQNLHTRILEYQPNGRYLLCQEVGLQKWPFLIDMSNCQRIYIQPAVEIPFKNVTCTFSDTFLFSFNKKEQAPTIYLFDLLKKTKSTLVTLNSDPDRKIKYPVLSADKKYLMIYNKVKKRTEVTKIEDKTLLIFPGEMLLGKPSSFEHGKDFLISQNMDAPCNELFLSRKLDNYKIEVVACQLNKPYSERSLAKGCFHSFIINENQATAAGIKQRKINIYDIKTGELIKYITTDLYSPQALSFKDFSLIIKSPTNHLEFDIEKNSSRPLEGSYYTSSDFSVRSQYTSDLLSVYVEGCQKQFSYPDMFKNKFTPYYQVIPSLGIDGSHICISEIIDGDGRGLFERQSFFTTHKAITSTATHSEILGLLILEKQHKNKEPLNQEILQALQESGSVRLKEVVSKRYLSPTGFLSTIFIGYS